MICNQCSAPVRAQDPLCASCGAALPGLNKQEQVNVKVAGEDLGTTGDVEISRERHWKNFVKQFVISMGASLIFSFLYEWQSLNIFIVAVYITFLYNMFIVSKYSVIFTKNGLGALCGALNLTIIGGFIAVFAFYRNGKIDPFTAIATVICFFLLISSLMWGLV